MRRFFIYPETVVSDTIELTGPEAKHMVSVLRLQPGQQVEFFNGTGEVFAAIITVVAKNRLTAKITSTQYVSAPTTPHLTLVQSLLKGKKMDFLIQKATELGVHSFLPLETRYCENRGKRQQQHSRWQRIMIEACKQCQRLYPMHIAPVSSLNKADFTPFTHKYLAWENEEGASLPDHIRTATGSICIVIGPEGGFHHHEIQFFTDAGFQTFSLGPLILRGETAALSAISIVQYLTGALGANRGE